LSSRFRQTTTHRRPPGTKARWMLRIATTGLAKNITPIRENT
jgi:hypothetical protein